MLKYVYAIPDIIPAVVVILAAVLSEDRMPKIDPAPSEGVAE